MASVLQPLGKQFAITDEKGNPTDYFIRWAQQRQIDIQSGVTPAQVQALINAWAAQRDINAGFGLSGGGNLSSDVTINLNAGLDDLTDVDTVTNPPAGGDSLTWDDTLLLWVPGPGGGSAGVTFYFDHGPPSSLHNHGDFYFDIDTLPYTLYVQWDGTVGHVPTGGGGGGGGGGIVQLGQVITSGSATTVAFTAIPQFYNDLELRVYGRCTAAATAVEAYVQFNGDTTNTYDWKRWNVGGTASAVATNKINIAELSGSTAPANTAGSSSLYIPSYSTTVFHKVVNGEMALKNGTSATNLFSESVAGFWRSTAAITSMLIFPLSGGFVDGSVFTLYGRV